MADAFALSYIFLSPNILGTVHLKQNSPQWGVYILIQADGVLKEPAYKAIDDIAAALKSKEISSDILVDLVLEKNIERYHFENNKHFKKESIELKLPLLDLSIEGAHRVFSKNPHHTMVIFSGHSTGVIEPYWDTTLQRWMIERDEGDSPYNNYFKEVDKEFYHKVHDIHSFDYINDAGAFLKWGFRINDGKVLFQKQEFKKFIKTIGEQILHNKRVDIIGFDSCALANIEIAEELAPFARYMLASQECQEKEGWSYGALLDLCLKKYVLESSCNHPRDLVRSYVYFHQLMQKKIGNEFYTLSAFDLSKTERLINAMEKFSLHCIKLFDSADSVDFFEALIKARRKSERSGFMPYIIDLLVFNNNLEEELSLIFNTPQIKALLDTSYELAYELQEFIIASCAGQDCFNALGCSIYFPIAHIDKGYDNEFLHLTGWRAFLNYFTGNADAGGRVPRKIASLQFS